MAKLTKKQQAFADYYIQTANATESARRAGYSEKTCSEMGYENLNKPHISEYITERMEKVEKKRIADGDEVLEFLSAVMRGEVLDQFDLDPSLSDRLTASKELFKRWRLGETKEENKGTPIINIVGVGVNGHKS